MKKLFIFALMGIFMVVMPGCQHKKVKHIGNDNGFVWYESENDGLIGAIDQNDNELFPSRFKTIELVHDFINGNGSKEYDWQLQWKAKDDRNNDLEITLFVFEDGWRYFYVKNTTRKHKLIAVQDYSNVILDFSNQDDDVWIESTYCHYAKSWYFMENAPSLSKLRYFYVRTHEGDGVYRDDGTPIIPVSRGYGMIWAYEQDNRAWYKSDNVICESNGKELFRYYVEDCVNVLRMLYYFPDNLKKYKWLDGSEYLAYDPNKGFISVYMNDAEDAYNDFRVHYTGIKLSSSSSSFDVQPSGDNEPAEEINL